MIEILSFTFNPFQENTYLLISETNNCIIVDPGMSDQDEEKRIDDVISSKNLKPLAVINTHCHIDHVMGNARLCEQYKIPLYAGEFELPVLEMAMASAVRWGLPYRQSPQPNFLMRHGDHLFSDEFGIDIAFTPGHSPGHVILILRSSQCVLSGDVLFKNGVGRVDLPGGNALQLEQSILGELYNLPDDFTVYCGHGDSTTIGAEKASNPFVRPGFSLFR